MVADVAICKKKAIALIEMDIWCPFCGQRNPIKLQGIIADTQGFYGLTYKINDNYLTKKRLYFTNNVPMKKRKQMVDKLQKVWQKKYINENKKYMEENRIA